MAATVAPAGKAICMLFLCCLLTDCKLAELSCEHHQHIDEENVRNCLMQVLKPNSMRKTAPESPKCAVHFSGSDVSGMFNQSGPHGDPPREADYARDVVCLFSVDARTGDDNTLEVYLKDVPTEARKMMSSRLTGMIPFLILPGLLMAGILPWVLPGLNLIVSFATMMNQMAFSSSLFSLIRGYIFDTRQEEHVVYVNNGYKNQHYKH